MAGQKHEILAAAEGISSWMINIRRQIHMYPELGLDCFKTSDLVKATLKELNVYYYTDKTYAKTGVVGRIGSGDAPRVALRADMDALPVQELYEWEYKSKLDGVFHACGHDAHVTMLLGAAKLLQERYENNKLQGTVYLIFQPAEETGEGAKLMVEDGALKDAEAVFGLHVADVAPVGVWGSKPGILMAGAQKFNARINGKGGHGGRPHEAIDPVVAAAHVITVGSIHGGDANNVIPDFVDLGGTFRHVESNRATLAERKQRILDVIGSQAKVHRCTADPNEWDEMELPALVNGEDAFEFARGVALAVLQDENRLLILTEPSTTSEDFPFYLEKVPGAFAFVGCAAPFPDDGIVYRVHNPRFIFNEACLAYGAALHTTLAVEYIADPPSLVSPQTTAK